MDTEQELQQPEAPDGLCKCGCGAEVDNQYLPGHNIRANPPTGPDNPNWEGGRMREEGYIKVLCPDHPRAGRHGYVREHVLLAERALGGPVPDQAEIHHVNGDGEDNSSGNLVICEDHAYHMILEMRGRALRHCGNANWRLCTYCGEYGPPEDMGCRHRPERSDEYYHRECNARYERERRNKAAS